VRKVLITLAVLAGAGAGVAAAVLPDGRGPAGSDGRAITGPPRTSVPTGPARPDTAGEPRRTRPDVRRARCPAGLARCAVATGRVILVESVDPDGDGDLHLVLAGGGVTAPGLTALDIAPALRRRRDPEVGDLVSAAGQVQTGSHRQSQIHVHEWHLARRPSR
jgi:hypothetical protein